MDAAPSMAFHGLQTPIERDEPAPPPAPQPVQSLGSQLAHSIEVWLERERDQLPLWLPVGLGLGIAAWFMFPLREQWIGFLLATLGIAAAGPLLGWPHRIGRVVGIGGAVMALGCGLAWMQAVRVDHPVLTRPLVTEFSGTIERVEDRPAEDKMRLIIRIADASALKLARVRVTLANPVPNPTLAAGAEIRIRARLAPPPGAALPGGYSFTRAAWFLRLGAVGQVLGEVQIITAAPTQPGLRDRLSAHVRAQIGGSAGGIASAFASGDRGGIAPEDEDAMRASGLTHLLSISGLHVTAVVAAAMFLALRLLALSPYLALRWPLLALSAGVGAAAGIGYTLLTGAEVPTIRSCIAAVLVLVGLALGREALTLRLVATGAIGVLLLWPESLVGASFQLSFAAITAIVALHEQPWIKALLARREELWIARFSRSILGLLLTGIVVEVMLAPIALFHFHKSGIYGALANLIAIPLTTFVIMPLEALALLLDSLGWGRPFWWATGQALSLLLALAHKVAAVPGAVAMLPSMPTVAFALIIAGGLLLLLLKTRVRYFGLPLVAAGALWAAEIKLPDVLITNDGRHMAVRSGNGSMALLRERTGDFVRDVMAERAGEESIDALIEDRRDADCTPEICVASLRRGGRTWLVGATRSQNLVPWRDLVSLCPRLDIIVSERRLPPKCQPKWIKADRDLLQKTGGLAITLGNMPYVETTKDGRDDHPWTVQSDQ
jgi:competence protein ComEC